MSDVANETMHSFVHKRNEAKIKEAEEELKELLNPEEEEEATEVTQQEEPAAPSEAEPKEDLTAEERSFKKRYGDIQRHMATKEKEWQSRIERLEGQLDKATKNELVLPKSKEDIQAWTSKYPDVAGIVEAIAEQKANERTLELDGRLKEVEAMRSSAKKEKAEAQLISLHPDFESIRSDDAFHEWAEEQPKVVQDALYENMDDVKSVARVIDLYKSDKGIKSKKSSPDRGAASAVKSRGRTVVDSEESSRSLSESMVNKMSLKEYEKRQDEIMDAMRSGKFIYDMS
jgi:hypothetical protein